MSDSLAIVVRSNPNLSPGLVYAASQSSDPVSTGDKYAGLKWAVDARHRLQGADSDHQLRAWNTFNESEQKLLQAVGYAAPHGGGFFSEVGHFFGSAFSAAGVPLKAVQHLYRAESLALREHDLATPVGGLTGVLGSALAHPGEAFKALSDLGDTWRQTREGEKFIYKPEEVTILPPQYREVALDAARGMSEGELTAKYGDLAYEATKTDGWQQHLAELNARKISPGRDLASQMGLRAIFKPGTSTTVLPGFAGFSGVHADVYNYISGAGDGVFDWLADPLIFGGKIVKGAREARFLVRGAADWDRVASFVEVRRGMARVAAEFGEGGNGAAGVLRDFPKLRTDFVEEMAQKNLNSIEAVDEFFREKSAVIGTAGGWGKGMFEVPRLTPAGPIRIAAKETGESLIEKMRSSNLPVVNQAGKFMRKAVTLVPQSREFRPHDAFALDRFQQIALFGMDRKAAEKLVNAYAVADQGGKWNIYRSMLHDTFDALGWRNNHDLWDYGQKFVGDMEGMTQKFNFGLDLEGRNISSIDGRYNAAITSSQINNYRWAVPDFAKVADLTSWVHKMRVLFPETFGHLPEGAIHRFMTRAWKPLVLLRMGFPIRVAGEEAARAMLEEGLIPFTKAGLAASSAKGARTAEILRGDAYLLADKAKYVEDLKALYTDAGKQAPLSLRAAPRVAPHWIPWRDHIAERTIDAFANVKGALAGEKYLKAANLAVRLHEGRLIPEEVATGGSRRLDTDQTLAQTIREAGSTRKIEYRPTSTYKGYHNSDPLYAQMWQSNIAMHAQEPEMQIWLAHADDAAREQALYDWLRSEEGLKRTEGAARRDAIVRDAEAAPESAAAMEAGYRDWARKINLTYKSVTHAPTGEMLEPVVKALRVGAVPSTKVLDQLPADLKPRSVLGQEMVLSEGKGVLQSIINFGFERYIDPMINSIAREPMYIHELAKALDELEPLAARLGNSASAQKALEEAANHRAIGKVVPNIHDPTLRSQMQQSHRALLPFYFAQEQFFKRWARALSRDPAIFRKAQLTMMGLRHSGFLHKDAQGDDYFVYPAAGFSQGVLMKVGKYLFGADPMLPVAAGFVGKVKQLNPSTERVGLPSFGPLLSIPLTAFNRTLGKNNAVVHAASRGILGDYSYEKPIWEQVMPVVGVRMLKALTADPEKDSQFLSVQLNAAQQLVAAGHGPESETPEAVDEFLDRVRQWSRIFLINRAVYGFNAPSALYNDFHNTLTPEYRKLIETSDSIDAATTEFLRRHPDATPFTVFQSQVKPGSRKPLPTNEVVGRFLSDHPDFIKRYGAAATWFLPSAPAGYDPRVYTQEIASELRRRKTPKEFYGDIKTAVAGDIYYPSYQRYKEAAAGLRGAQLADLQKQWKVWSEAFLNTHPLFRDHLDAGELRADQRQDTINRVRTALSDPKRPKTKQEESLRQVVASWDDYQRALLGIYGRRDQGAKFQRDSIRTAFRAYGESLGDPIARQFFHGLIAPDLGE